MPPKIPFVQFAWQCCLGSTRRYHDINKGYDELEEYRSRLVAKEIKRDKREDLFAATPPLEAKKALFSLAVTDGVGWGKFQLRLSK